MPSYIDARGDLVKLTDAFAQQTLQLRLSREALARYVIVNLGWAEITQLDRRISIRCRPSKMTDMTLAALLYEVSDHFDGRIALSVFGSEWSHRVFFSFQSFFAFMVSVCPGMECPDPWGSQRFIRTPISNTKSQFSSILAQARLVSSNLVDADGMVRVLGKMLDARWSVCRLDDASSQSVIVALSDEFDNFNPSWRAQGNGAKLVEFANREYGSWAARHQRAVVEKMADTCENVDAIVTLPLIGEMRLRYECLTLPVRRADGSIFVVCGAIDAPTINLRKASG